MMMKIPRNEAYSLLRKVDTTQSVESNKVATISADRLVDQIQSYADNTTQLSELNKRCREAGLQFFFDAGQRIQFRKSQGV